MKRISDRLDYLLETFFGMERKNCRENQPCFLRLRGSFGNIFLKRVKCTVILLPAITKVTATIIKIRPIDSRSVNVSPNTVIPKKMAVTGSRAPNIAVGVVAMYWIVPVVLTKEIAVGMRA